jgi:hypothetical protein
MKNIKLLSIILILILTNSCYDIQPYLPSDPLPSTTFFPAPVDVELINSPPLYIPTNQARTMTRPVSQYFEIAIPPCVDMTGKSDYLINSLADMFYTSLFEVKRFTLMDRMELTRLQSSVDKKYQDSLQLQGEQNKQILKQIENDKYQSVLNILQSNTDGVMLIYITSDKKSTGGKNGIVYIDFRIVNKKNEVLYAGSKDIHYNHDRNTNSLDFDRTDISSVAKNIAKNFPNPHYQEGLAIIDRRDDIITVNVGKNQNISKGMIGYVVKATKNSYGDQLISYRAEFIVSEVFENTFKAFLVPRNKEEELIIKTINIGEPIKMK